MPAKADIDRSEQEVLVDLRLPPDLRSPGRARHALSPLEDRFDEEILFKLRLLVSELVTNSVRHAGLEQGELINVRVLCEPGTVRVEVLDKGWGFPPAVLAAERGWELQQAKDPDWPGGWGLSLVGALADSWGVVHNDVTTVWFEVMLARGKSL